jgi:hypothetical protein
MHGFSDVVDATPEERAVLHQLGLAFSGIRCSGRRARGNVVPSTGDTRCRSVTAV